MQDRSPAVVHRRYLDRRVTGTPAYVASVVTQLRDSGRLVHSTPPQWTPDGATVVVRFLDRPAPATAVARRRRRWPVVAVATAVVTVGGVGVYALIRLVDALVAALPAILAALAVLALIAILSGPARSRVVCVTMHGPGCRHH
ncbi:hypothetical protein AB0J68_25885 [Micromonospora sp. NPDC049580]|uniref:hypothetical protein n=1 Tax=Micromonospora sp. NPDC049580 TaxID=3154832 RepID=UPI00341D5A81